jgi:hypothetical protein
MLALPVIIIFSLTNQVEPSFSALQQKPILTKNVTEFNKNWLLLN